MRKAENRPPVVCADLSPAASKEDIANNAEDATNDDGYAGLDAENRVEREDDGHERRGDTLG